MVNTLRFSSVLCDEFHPFTRHFGYANKQTEYRVAYIYPH